MLMTVFHFRGSAQPNGAVHLIARSSNESRITWETRVYGQKIVFRFSGPIAAPKDSARPKKIISYWKG